VRADRREHVLLSAVGTLAIIFLLLPMVVVALASLNRGEFFTFPPESISTHWYGEFLGQADWRDALFLSLRIAALTAVASTVVGGMAGIAIARCSKRARSFLYVLLVAPLTIPPIVIAISLYPLVLDAKAVGDTSTFVLANTILTAPIVALLTVGAALNVDERVEHASLSCGASKLRTLLQITVPQVMPTAVAGGVLAFLSTLDEVVISVFLVAPGKTPLAVKMFLEVQSATPAVVTAASTLLIAVTIAVVGGLTLARSLRGRDAAAEDALPIEPALAGTAVR
jgi:mannopine transport system permease protein